MSKKRKFWKKKIKHFLVKPEEFEYNEDEQTYTPKEGLKFRFWIEGNLQIEGEYNQIQINFNDPDLLVLSKNLLGKGESVYRIPYSKIVAIELSLIDEKNTDLGKLIRINPEQSN